jgi:zinc transport system substrate-binding protein
VKLPGKKTIALLTIAVCITAVLSIQACNDTETADDNLLVIAVSIAPLGDFVQNVGGDSVEVVVMVPPSYSPHTYEPTPSQMAKISEADVYVKAGSGVEFEEAWMDDLIAQNPDMYVIDCSTDIAIIDNDPHIWNSPFNAQQMVKNIYQGLITVDPDNEDYYLTNKDGYIADLEELDSYITETLDGFSNTNFLIYHPAFGYLAAEYGLTQIAVEHEGKEPTPQVIQDCIDKAVAYNLNYVFVAPQFTTSYAETIAQEIGGQVLYVDPLPSSYISNMRSVAASIALELE